MNRATLVRGIQLVVLITLGTFAYLIFDGIRQHQSGLAEGFSHIQPVWLLLAAVLALQEGVIGGVRIWILGRVLSPTLRIRDAITSEFVLMFCAGVTPGQSAGPPAQAAVLALSGMTVADAATTEFVVAACTILFFLLTAAGIYVLHGVGLFVVPGEAQIHWLLGFAVIAYCTGGLCLVLGAAKPRLLKAILRVVSRILSPLWRLALGIARRSERSRAWAEKHLASPGAFTTKLAAGIDDCHAGFSIYLRRGKAAFALSLLLTVFFFWVRYSAAFFILLGLGLTTTPSSFVTIGPPLFQIILVQSLLNFALYLSPTPGASGIAEAGSNALMSPWVKGVFELPYLVIWRLLTLFLSMFVGGVYVFRYLGADVLEKQVKAAEEAKRALEAARHADVEAPVEIPRASEPVNNPTLSSTEDAG